MPVAAILFDCDGVIVDSEVVGLEDSVAYLADHGLPFGRDDLIRRFTGMRSDRFRAELRDAHDAARGRPSSESEFDSIFEGFLAIRRARRHETRLIDGADELISHVAQRPNIKMAVASSSGQSVLDEKIDRFGLRRFFGRHVYSADHVDHGKPAPDIFEFAAAQLRVATTDCLVIEDSPHGVTAGVASGATVWGFTGGGHCLADHAHRLVAEGAARVFASHGALKSAISDL